jgi:pyruvate dehydrogenase E2 component (dihydrolipoamide acetyltransferase)
MPDVVMPRLSDSMEEGTIVRWLVEDGQEVGRGEELVEIETDKATMTYEADVEGAVRIVAGEGDTVPLGAVIATIGEGGGDGASAAEGGEESGDGAPAAQAAEESDDGGPAAASREESTAESGDDDRDGEATGAAQGAQGVADEPEPSAATTGATAESESDSGSEAGSDGASGNGGGRVKASPVARRLAREHGVELSGLQGSGPGGRIVKADVEAAVAAPGAANGDGAAATPTEAAPQEAPAREEQPPPAAAPSAKGESTEVELSRVQAVIARRMAESKATIPDFALTVTADMTAAVALREQLKALAGEEQVVPSFNDLVVRASALALREHPRANGSYQDGRFVLHERVNVGVAVAAQDALLVPVVMDADHKTLGQIARETRGLAAAVRDGSITPPQLAGATFTVSNLGMYGITRFTAIVNAPQAAILAVGRLEPRPAVVDGQVAVRPQMDLTLTCDHRILYGADAALFLARIRDLLEQPLTMAL